jgi:SAM-dependent methyltransferase
MADKVKYSNDLDNFDPQTYWKSLLNTNDSSDLDRVGHPDMGRAFNKQAYEIRLASLKRALDAAAPIPWDLGVFEGAYGVGFYMNFWRSLNLSRVFGVELSEIAQQQVSARFPNFNLRGGDLAKINQWEDWEILIDSFGLVTAIDVIYHIIDVQMAASAISNLAKLVAPNGVFLVTDKFPIDSECVRENPHVVRRSIEWYEQLLKNEGFILEKLTPVFWCMDPPSHLMGQNMSANIAHLTWGIMRSSVKYLPSNSTIQNLLGNISGMFGSWIDSAILPVSSQTPNLTIAIFRKI